MKFRTSKLVVMAIVAVLGLSTIATAGDNIVIGTLPASGLNYTVGDMYTGGELITVNEDAPGTVANYWSFVDEWTVNVGGVRSLAKGYVDPTYGPTVLVGMGWGYPIVTTPIANGFTSPATTSFAGYFQPPYYDGVDTIASKPNGDVLVGIGGGMQNETVGGGEIYMYALNKTNLQAGAPGLSPYYNTTLRGATGYGLDFTEMESISNGTIVAAIHNLVMLADGYDLINSSTGGFEQSAEYPGVWQATFADHVSAMAVTSTGLVVTGLQNGYIDVRAMNDFGTVLASVTLASTIKEIEILANGNIAAGLANGDVDVLSAGLALLDSENFSAAIGGLAATSNGNLAIGAGSMFYLRSGSDLSSGTAGEDMGNPIGAIVSIVPEPVTMVLLGLGGLLMRRRSN
ncbi:MAG: PEP-CTERM sorting domain-containing protein [Sedimentisphaerales bacterium]